MKKIITYLIIIALLISSSYNMAYADEDTVKTVDIEEKLTAMGFLAENGYELDADITRADFVKIMLKYTGLYEVAQSCEVTEDVFRDVDKNNADAGFIKFAKDKKWLLGYDDSCFYPDYEIKFNQAVKIMVTVLGYNTIAEMNGGYPYGYLSIANNLGILEDVASDGENITYGSVLNMLDNSLDADIFDMFSENITFFEKYYGGKKAMGIIDAVPKTSLYSIDSGLKDGEVLIGGIKYNTTFEDIEKYIGYYVEYYYEEIDGELVVTFVKQHSKNSVLKVNSYDILGDDSEFSDTVFVYQDMKGRKKKEDISNAVIIYNGRADALYDKEDLNVANGFVEILDNDGDNKTDCVFVYDFTEIMVVDVVSQKDNSYYIVNKMNTAESYKLDINDSDKRFTFIKGDGKATIETISEKDVVMIGISKDGLNTICYISSDNITGIVRGVSEDEITIDETIAEKSNWFKNSENKDITNSDKIILSMNATLYLDYFGKIAAVDYTDEKGLQYGFAMDVKLIEDENCEERVLIEILTKTSELEKIWLEADKIKVNGKKTDNREAYQILTETKKKATNGDYTDYYDEGRGKMITSGISSARQLIQYELDDKGEIKTLNTVTKDGDLDFVTTFHATGYWYSYAKRNFMNKYYLSESGTTFYISPDKELSYVGNMEAQSPDTDDNYEWQVYLYNKNDDHTVDVVVVVDESGTGAEGVEFENTPKCAIVKNISSGINEDEEICDIITVVRDGTEKQIFMNDKMNQKNIDEFKRIKKGDIVFYTNDVKGNLSQIQRIYDADKKGKYGQIRFGGKNSLKNGTGRGEVHESYNYKTTSAECQITYAEVDKKVGQYLEYHCTPGDERVQYFASAAQKVYIVSTSSKKITVKQGSYQDIMPGDEILFTTQYSAIKEVVLFRD